MTSKMDRVTNLAILILCVVAVLTLIRTTTSSGASDRFPLSVKEGELLKGFSDLLPADRERTLLVALSPECGFCTESFPFYLELIRERTRREADVGLVAVVSDDGALEREREMLDAAGVRFDDLAVADFRELRLVGTPTLLLVDRGGRVLDLWVGRLRPEAREDVLRSLGG